MDTSIDGENYEKVQQAHRAFVMRNRLLDLQTINDSEVPTETWLMIFNSLVRKEDGILSRIQGVFIPFSDLMSGGFCNRASAHIPRGLTSFQKGISPTTRVFPELVYDEHEAGRTVLLLMSQKEKYCDAQWALWSVTYDTDGEVATSEVRFVDADFVCELFGTYRGVAHSMLDSLMLSLDRVVQEQAKAVELLRVVQGVWRRLM